MPRDIVSDVLNQMMNAVKANKEIVETRHYSKLLLSILAIAKLRGYISSYELKDKVLKIKIGKLNGCNAIKPRFVVSVGEIEKYVRRYLPARGIGAVIISTSKGLMTHQTAKDKNIGGSLIAYMY